MAPKGKTRRNDQGVAECHILKVVQGTYRTMVPRHPRVFLKDPFHFTVLAFNHVIYMSVCNTNRRG